MSYCDNCGIELTNFYSYSGGNLFSQNHNFFQAFLSHQGKSKEDNDHFRFCEECEKKFKNYIIEESVKELKKKNIANSNLLTYRFFKTNFAKEDWQKYQIALAENIKRHSEEWQIKEVNYQPYERKKPCPPDYQMPLVPGQIEKRTILFHRSFGLEYDQDGYLTLENSWDPQKIYFETDFLPEKWTEINSKIRFNDQHLSNKNKQQREAVLNYFKKKDIKSITLQDENLIIEYNNNSEKEPKKINNQELEEIKSFIKKLGKSELTLKDLEQSSNQSNSPKSNKGIYIGLAVVGILLIIGLIAWLVVRNKNKKK